MFSHPLNKFITLRQSHKKVQNFIFSFYLDNFPFDTRVLRGSWEVIKRPRHMVLPYTISNEQQQCSKATKLVNLGRISTHESRAAGTSIKSPLGRCQCWKQLTGICESKKIPYDWMCLSTTNMSISIHAKQLYRNYPKWIGFSQNERLLRIWM